MRAAIIAGEDPVAREEECDLAAFKPDDFSSRPGEIFQTRGQDHVWFSIAHSLLPAIS